MNKRIVYLSQMYEKIGDYLQKNGDAHVSSISTHCNHPEQIYYTLNLNNLKDDTERKIDVRYINVPIEQNETTENTVSNEQTESTEENANTYVTTESVNEIIETEIQENVLQNIETTVTTVIQDKVDSGEISVTANSITYGDF